MRHPRLKELAQVIETLWPDLEARIVRGFCNTDRKIGRLRHPGKGRWGNQLEVVERKTRRTIFTHNAAETYRHNGEVVRWIEERKRKST